MTAESPIEFARRYLGAIEAGATGEALAAFYQPDVVQEEFPNRLVAAGARRDLAGLLAGAERGQKVVRDQRYEIVHELAQGDRVALEVAWSATLKVALGPLPEGHVMRARLAIFLDLRDGRIAAQRSYDCYEPWPTG